jgi:hypothetical protein
MKTLKKQICRLLACTAMVAAALPAASAGNVYDNGAPNHQSGNNMGFAYQSEDFTLGAGTSINAVSFWSLEEAGAYRGSISWAIVGDSGGMPTGSILASGMQSSVTRTSLGSYLGLTEYSNVFNLSSPLALGSGTYWLVLHNGSFDDLGDPNEFLWETTAANSTTRGMESFDGGVTWTSNFNEHAFQVSAVPEPASVLMLAAGMLLVSALRRRDQDRGFTR